MKKVTRQPGNPLPLVRPVKHGRILNVPGQWELDILWRFVNQANVSLYVLIAPPLATRIADPLILDHSSPGKLRRARYNVDPGFEILVIPSSGAIERWLKYHLALPETLEQATIIGRFGFSYEAPDPAWERTKNWLRVAEWQQIVDSNPLAVSLVEHP